MFSAIIDSITTGDTSKLKLAIAGLLLSLPVIFLALCVHEVAHGFVANKLGDPTAKNLGRLTLNPLKHLDPIGFLSMVMFGYGWAKPVPINTRHFKKPRAGMALCAAAGPISNIVMALIFTAIMKIFTLVLPLIPTTTLFAQNVVSFTAMMLSAGVFLNLSYAVFNLIPIPPLDGSKILYMFLPAKIYMKVVQFERYIYFVLLALVIFGAIGYILYFVVVPTMFLLSLIFQIDFTILAMYLFF